MTTKHYTDAQRVVEKLLGGPLTLAMALRSTREGEGWPQATMARKLGLSRSALCDIEHGRKGVSPARAAHFARVLGYSEKVYVQLALQDEVERAGLPMHVDVRAA